MSQISGLFSPYLEKRRLNNITNLIKGNDLNILDIGCGRAAILEIVESQVNNYVGVDLIPELINDNKSKYPHQTFITGNILNIQLPDNINYDYITMAAFIEHLTYEDNIKLFRKFKSLLKSEGQIIMTTPHPRAESIHNLGAKIGLFSREAAHEHKCFFDKKLLQKLASETGFNLDKYNTFQFGLNQVFSYKLLNS